MPTRLAWIAFPLAAFFAVLVRLWHDAPVLDDYYTVLLSVVSMLDAESAREWLGVVFAQHNEHRVATVRLAARAVDALFGRVDFRALVLLGDLAFTGVFLLMWAEFRATLTGPVLAAAAFVMFQWSYYEAALWTSGGLTNMGVIFFSVACLYLALRDGLAAAAASVACALLAVGCSASGLLALPVAAVACAFTRRIPRAWILGAIAAIVWIAYFRGYVSPPAHASPLAAFSDPFSAIQLFLVVIGGIVPRVEAAMTCGVVILGALAWLTWKGAWKAHPTAAAWIGFLVVSAGAAAAGRAGWGVFHASRYAIYSTCLVVLVLLGWHEITRPWRPRTMAFALAVSIAFSLTVTWMSWPGVALYAVNTRLLGKPAPAVEGAPVRYFGMTFPNLAESARVLDEAEAHGVYSPREMPIHAASVRTIASIPPSARIAGHLDEVRVTGNRIAAVGWTETPATVPGRTFSIFPAEAVPESAKVRVVDRSDAARVVGDARLVSSGFELELEYSSEGAARRIAQTLCLVVEAPGQPPAVLSRSAVSCVPMPERRGA